MANRKSQQVITKTTGKAITILSIFASLPCPSDKTSPNGVAPNDLTLSEGPFSLGCVGEDVQADLNMGLMSYQISEYILPKNPNDEIQEESNESWTFPPKNEVVLTYKNVQKHYDFDGKTF